MLLTALDLSTHALKEYHPLGANEAKMGVTVAIKDGYVGNEMLVVKGA